MGSFGAQSGEGVEMAGCHAVAMTSSMVTMRRRSVNKRQADWGYEAPMAMRLQRAEKEAKTDMENVCRAGRERESRRHREVQPGAGQGDRTR